jgi:hypothetical protein
MRFLRSLPLAFLLLLAAPLHAQTPAKTAMQKAAPIVDTLAARMNKLVRDIEAAGPDMPKVRALAEKVKQDNERLETQLAELKKDMTPAESGELEVYTQLKMGRSPEKLKVALEKASKDAAEAAAKVGPATVAKYREQIGQLATEGAEHVKHVRDAGADAQKREHAWTAFLAWDGKRQDLLHAIRKDPNVMEPDVLVTEAEDAHQPLALHASRLYRMLVRPMRPELQKELTAVPGRAKPIAELEAQFQKASGPTALKMAQTQLAEAKSAALEVTNAELTRDEVDEVRDCVLEAMAPALKKIRDAAAKAKK